MFQNKPTDLLAFVHTDTDPNSKAAFDFVGPHVELGPNMVVLLVGWIWRGLFQPPSFCNSNYFGANSRK